MKKLYLYRKNYDVIFVSEESSKSSIKSEAEFFLEEQNKCFDPPIVITEITSKNQIIDDWQGDALIWGTDKVEMTASQFLDKFGNEEYQEYLRLKDKFEK